jgi:hypothetical protein
MRYLIGRLFVVVSEERSAPSMPLNEPMCDGEEKRNKCLFVSQPVDRLKCLKDRFGHHVLGFVVRTHHGAHKPPQRTAMWFKKPEERILEVAMFLIAHVVVVCAQQEVGGASAVKVSSKSQTSRLFANSPAKINPFHTKKRSLV